MSRNIVSAKFTRPADTTTHAAVDVSHTGRSEARRDRAAGRWHSTRQIDHERPRCSGGGDPTLAECHLADLV